MAAFGTVTRGARRAWHRGRAWAGARDLRVLASVLVVVAAAWGFVALAGRVSDGSTRAFDEALLLALRERHDLGDPIGPAWLEEAVRDLTALGSPAILSLATAAVAGYLALRRAFHALLMLLAAMIGGAVLESGLKSLFARPRPDLVPHLVAVASPSFPSGHAMLSAIGYLTLGALLARLVRSVRLKTYVIGVALLATGLAGASRVYMGVHYPTDVLAGWTIGLVWAIVCWLVARWLQRRGAVEPPQ